MVLITANKPSGCGGCGCGGGGCCSLAWLPSPRQMASRSRCQTLRLAFPFTMYHERQIDDSIDSFDSFDSIHSIHLCLGYESKTSSPSLLHSGSMTCHFILWLV